MDEQVEEAIKVAQKYLENCPTVILGCGASIPYKIPSMQQLSKNLIDTLDQQYDSDPTWQKFSALLQKGVDLEQALQEVTVAEKLNNDIIKTTWAYINDKDLDCFDKLCSKKTTLALSNLFQKLLEAHPKHISVITTNYDRLAEYAADFADAHVYSGFTGKYWGNFHGADYPIFRRDLRTVDIWKVHGSLDWFKKDDIPVQVSLSRELPSDHFPLIVTPGVAKYQETHKDPYRTVISKTDRVIRDSSCFLCIGYGFNDEHIQPKLIQEIQLHKKPIVIVTKELSQSGSDILKGVPKNVVFQEKSEGVTSIYINSDKIEVEGSLWNLDDFIKIIW